MKGLVDLMLIWVPRGREKAAVVLDCRWLITAIRLNSKTPGECLDEGTLSREYALSILRSRLARRH